MLDKKRAEHILDKNLEGCEYPDSIITIGVIVVVQTPTMNVPFHYRSISKNMRKVDLDKFIAEHDKGNEEKEKERRLVAVKATRNILLEEVKKQIEENKTLMVLENDNYTYKAFNCNCIKEVYSFIEEPNK